LAVAREPAAVPLAALLGREALSPAGLVRVAEAASAASGEERLHAAMTARASRAGPGRILIELQR